MLKYNIITDNIFLVFKFFGSSSAPLKYLLDGRLQKMASLLSTLWNLEPHMRYFRYCQNYGELSRKVEIGNTDVHRLGKD
jgi:hypothetical protein